MLVSCRISQNTDDLFVCLIKDRSEDKLRRQKSSCCQTCGQLEQLQNIQTTPGKMCLSSGQRHVCNKARIQNLGRPYMDILESLTRLTTTKQITMCAAGHYKYDPLDCLLPERFSVLLPVEWKFTNIFLLFLPYSVRLNFATGSFDSQQLLMSMHRMHQRGAQSVHCKTLEFTALCHRNLTVQEHPDEEFCGGRSIIKWDTRYLLSSSFYRCSWLGILLNMAAK